MGTEAEPGRRGATGSSVLVVDDERNIRRAITMILEGEGIGVRTAGSAEEALEILEREDVDVAIIDLKLPGMSGIELLQRIRAPGSGWTGLPVLVISGHASLQEAVEAIKLGASDFFEKPLDRDRVVLTVRNWLEQVGLRREIAEIRAKEDARRQLIGVSPAMRRLVGEIEKVAPTRGRVLITGESGTGKELVAWAIHRLSSRAGSRFVKVNCAAIPSELIESELFGHERGAFTGAQGRRRGQFELANGGTLLLDEVGDMSLGAQAKVLRVLESGELVRVGGESTVAVDVRVLAATNKDLAALVREGRFREDLFFRLNVVHVRVAPLRERAEDIPLLVDAFVREICRENGLKLKRVDVDVLRRLESYSWPGNVRELKNVVERMVIMSGDTIVAADLPTDMGAATAKALRVAPTGAATLRGYKEEAERAFIVETLERLGWNVSKAAQQLGIERTNLHKKMKALGIRREDGGTGS